SRWNEIRGAGRAPAGPYAAGSGEGARCHNPDLRRRSSPRLRAGDGQRAPSKSLVAHAGAAFGQEFHELRAADDRGTGHEGVLVELALLEARRADVDRAAGLREVIHQLAQRGEPLLADVVGVALLGEAHALDAQEHQGLLARAHRGVGDDEAHRGPVLVVLRVGEADTESVGHDSVLLSTDLVDGMLLCDQRVAGHAAPGRNIGPRAGVVRGEPQELPRFHCLHAQAKLEHEIAAAEITRIPLGVGGARSRRTRGHGSLRSPGVSSTIRPSRMATMRSAYARARCTWWRLATTATPVDTAERSDSSTVAEDSGSRLATGSRGRDPLRVG